MSTSATAWRLRVSCPIPTDWRATLRLRGDHTLRDLEACLRAAYGLPPGPDGRYFMSGEKYDDTTELAPDDTRLEALELRPGHLFLYGPWTTLFLFQLELVAVEPGVGPAEPELLETSGPACSEDGFPPGTECHVITSAQHDAHEALFMEGRAYDEARRRGAAASELRVRAFRVLELLEQGIALTADDPTALLSAFYGGAGLDVGGFLLALRGSDPALLGRALAALQGIHEATRERPLPVPLLEQLLATSDPAAELPSQLRCKDAAVLAPIAAQLFGAIGSREQVEVVRELTGVHLEAWFDQAALVLARGGRLVELRTAAARLAAATRSRYPLAHAAYALARAGEVAEARELLEEAHHFDGPDTAQIRIVAAVTLRAAGHAAPAEAALRAVLGERWLGPIAHTAAKFELLSLLEEQRRRAEAREIRRASKRWWRMREAHAAHAAAHRLEVPLEDDLPPLLPFRRVTPKQGRNERCACGSGKKVKRCCGVA